MPNYVPPLIATFNESLPESNTRGWLITEESTGKPVREIRESVRVNQEFVDAWLARCNHDQTAEVPRVPTADEIPIEYGGTLST